MGWGVTLTFLDVGWWGWRVIKESLLKLLKMGGR